MKIFTLSMLICILILPISILYAGDSLSVVDAWVLEAPPGMKVMAAYMTLKNNSDNVHELKGVSSPEFERVEMHRTIIENELASMVKQDSMTVNAGEVLKFEPGGSHLMLINPKKILKSGYEIDLTLILKNEKKLNTKAHVRKHSEMTGMEHHN